MGLNRLSVTRRVLAHAVLFAGAVLFLLPFLWMIVTSFKVTREMTGQRPAFLPAAPSPQDITPYIDRKQFSAPRLPDAMPEAVWELALPRVEAMIDERLSDWSPRTPGRAENAPPAPVSGEDVRAEMIEGLFEYLDGRLSDEVRQKAFVIEASQGKPATDNKERPSESRLSSESIQAAASAVVEEAGALVTDEVLASIFDACYRRICLGEVRVRTSDFRSHALYSGSEWEPLGKGVTLVQRDDATPRVQEARIDFVAGGGSGLFRLAARGEDVNFRDVDRVFVSYRSDAAWARLGFTVRRGGRVYTTRDQLYNFERDWVEQELRWPEDATDGMERRLYAVLHEVPGAVAPPGEFQVILTIHRVSTLEAWVAKATQNYRQTFREVPYSRYIATSFSLSILNIVLSIFSCTLVAYGFARLQWPGRGFFFVVLLATMMLPPQVTMIPSFLVIKHLGWYNTLLPLWVVAAFGTPFFIFLLRQFFKNIPVDLEDAARIDGCGFLRIYWHVMLPLVKPVVATIAIFTFMGTWNNFMGPLIYVNDERLFPLALGLFKFLLGSGTTGDNVVLVMAASLVMTLPVIVLFFSLQRYFIQGITLTGSKG